MVTRGDDIGNGYSSYGGIARTPYDFDVCHTRNLTIQSPNVVSDHVDHPEVLQ